MSSSRRVSDGHQHSPWFEELVRAHYRNAGRKVLLAIDHIKDPELQKLGVDMRVTQQPSGLIDDCEIKFREEVYSDVLLERYHENLSDGERTAGWINRKLICNRFMYVFVPKRGMLVMAWSDLHRTWNDNRKEWSEKFRSIESTKENRGYRTVSCAVPIDLLRTLIPVFVVALP